MICELISKSNINYYYDFDHFEINPDLIIEYLKKYHNTEDIHISRADYNGKNSMHVIIH